MQQPGETLQQLWHTLIDLAAPCDFGEINENLRARHAHFTYA